MKYKAVIFTFTLIYLLSTGISCTTRTTPAGYAKADRVAFKKNYIYYIRFYDQRPRLEVKGHDLEWDGSYLHVRNSSGQKSQEISPDEISHLVGFSVRTDQTEALKGTLIGSSVGALTLGGIGLGIGFSCGGAQSEPEDCQAIQNASLILGLVGGAVIGGLLGFGFGKSTPKQGIHEVLLPKRLKP